MKQTLLKHIACRKCQSDFQLTIKEQNGQEIMSGSLNCPKCKTTYPIMKGVPRFIAGLNVHLIQ